MTLPGGGRFAKLWASSTASALGSGLVLVAAPLYVAAHTSNPLVVSATTGVSWLPWLPGRPRGSARRPSATAPFWAGFVVAAVVTAAAWRVFDRATVAQAYAEPAEPVPYTWTNG